MPDGSAPSAPSSAPAPAAPPSSTATKPAGQSISREQGLAYYEKLRKDLRETIKRKHVLDKTLAQYEDNIYRAETAYLEETQNGNIIRGFDNYIKGGVARRKTNFNDMDRIFSLSSITMAAKLQQDESTPATAASTPTIDQLPRVASQATKNKKPTKRKKGEDESESPSELDTPGPKRVRISFSGQSTA